MAKKPTSRRASTKESREKVRRERDKAKAKGKHISLSEARKRAGGLEYESQKIREEKKIEKPVEKPVEKKPIELKAPIQLKEPISKTKLAASAAIGAGAGLAIGAAIPIGAVAGVIGFGSRAAIGVGTRKAIQSGMAQQARVTTGKVGGMVVNKKTNSLTTSFLSKIFSTKTMAFGGAWASSIFLGRWGQAEAPEAILIPVRDMIKQAETPEDWVVVNEHLQYAAEISDSSTWEEILLWSPFSAIEGISEKVKGVARGVKILQETAIKAQEKQRKEEEAGETEFAAERRISDEAKEEREIESMKWKSQYYALIREGKFEEADELLAAQS